MTPPTETVKEYGPCQNCNGSGRLRGELLVFHRNGLPCPVCEGTGRVVTRTVERNPA